MSETSRPEDEGSTAGPESSSEVAYVVPATAYDEALVHIGIPPGAPVEIPELRPTVLPSAPIAWESPKVLESVRAMGEALGRKLDVLQTAFDREIRAESTREKVVDRLHAELQEYKNDLFLKVLRPVFVDLIQLHDDIGKMAEAQESPEGELARMVEMLRDVQQGIEDILYRQGVEPFSQPDDAFDPRRQRAVATVPTDDPGFNKTVAVRHRKGFRSGDKVIRAEIVSVYAQKKGN